MLIPEVKRAEPSLVANEREMLDGWVDYHRATLLWKCQGLTEEQLKQRAVPPSKLSLLGLVRHMTEVENGWFSRAVGRLKEPRYFTGETPDGEFDWVDDADAAADIAVYLAECAESRRAVADLTLDHTFPRRDDTFSLRWVYTHMLEEYARHNGHADLLRERIDGATGD
jgi:uncharacterized damage-inducible protein DinB